MNVPETPETGPTPAGEAVESESSGMEGVVRQTGLYGLGNLLGKALGFALLPVYTRFLTPADYGVMELVEMTLDVVMIFAGGSMLSGVFRFYHKAEAEAERRAVVSSAFLLLSGSFALLGGGAFLFAPGLSRLIFGTDAHTLILRLAAATVVISPMLMVPHAYLRMQNQAGLYVSSNLLKLVVGAVLNVVLLLRGWGVAAIFTSALVTTALVGLGLTVRMVREVGLRGSKTATADLVRFGLPLVAMNVATFLFTFGDRYFLQSAGDETVVGLYMFAYQFGFLLMMLGFTPFMSVWQPRRFEIMDRPNRDHLYASGFVYTNLMLFAVAAGMVLFIDDFFRIMTTPPFYPAAALVPLILLAYVFQAWANVQDIGILIVERTGFLTLANWVAAGVALLGFIVLIPRYLAWGAAWATLLTFVVRYVLIFGFSQWLWPVRYQWTPVFKIAALAVLVSAVGILLPLMPILPSVALRSVLYIGFLWLLWHADILTPEDRGAVAARAGVLVARIRRL